MRVMFFQALVEGTEPQVRSMGRWGLNAKPTVGLWNGWSLCA